MESCEFTALTAVASSPVDSFPSNNHVRLSALEGLAGGLQNLEQPLRFARHFHFPHEPARIIHNANARLLD